jgi:hypothetical protein
LVHGQQVSELKRKAFIKHYLGAAQGNATKAAIMAGYSETSAKVTGSRLLSAANVQQAIQRHANKVEVSTERSLQNIGAIANEKAAKVSAGDILKANELILKVKGALSDRQTEARVTVNIGFLTNDKPSAVIVQELAPPTRVVSPGVIDSDSDT